MENKKGIELSQAFGAVLTLVLVAVLVIIAIVIFVSLADNFEAEITDTASNESLAVWEVSADTNQTLAAAALCGFGAVASGDIVIYNATANNIIDAGNYTAYPDGNIVNITDDASGYAWKVTYNYTWGSGACTAADEMTTEFGNYTSLIGLVGTIIFLGLVIGVLVASFAFGGRREV